jgi:MYXO-CTERM domain-containing protein
LVSGGTATLSAPIPPGLIRQPQEVQVVAQYGGDTHHLASVSSLHEVSFSTPLTFCIQPTVLTIAPGAEFQFAGAQGVPPIHWYLDADSTCVTNGEQCLKGSTLDELSGVFVAGTGQPGYVLVEAIDSAYEETFSELTVGTPLEDAGPPPWGDDAGVASSACAFGIDAGPLPVDGGADAGEDSGPPITGVDSGPPVSGPDASPPPVTDSGPGTPTPDASPITGEDAAPGEDAGPAPPTTVKGCSCTTAGQNGGAPAGMLAGVALGLGLIARRRRSRR